MQGIKVTIISHRGNAGQHFKLNSVLNLNSAIMTLGSLKILHFSIPARLIGIDPMGSSPMPCLHD